VTNAILDIDVGNTRTKWRLLTAEGTRQQGMLANEVLSQLVNEVACSAVCRVRVACVAAPVLREQLSQMVSDAWGCNPEFAMSALECAGLRNGYARPLQLGIDRWLAAVAAANLGQGACLIIDAGSAVTVDAVNDKAVFLGGYIIPGLYLQQRCLTSSTGSVRCDIASAWPDNYQDYGVSTAEAVQRGAALALIAVVEKSIVQFKSRWPKGQIYITGGDAQHIAESVQHEIYREPDLVFTGLALALP
jgi:type III pantothenate kinase